MQDHTGGDLSGHGPYSVDARTLAALLHDAPVLDRADGPLRHEQHPPDTRKETTGGGTRGEQRGAVRNRTDTGRRQHTSAYHQLASHASRQRRLSR